MSLTQVAQATLLLTSYFSRSTGDDVRPLSNQEWGKFAFWLHENKLTPADLLVSDPRSLLAGWADPKITPDRIVQLLARGHALALAMEKWQRAGLWVVTRSDPEYPQRLKQRLQMASPPILFGCGNKALLNAGGLAVVGSRNAIQVDLDFAEQTGAKAAAEKITIVSGGARGIDEAAMLGAMQQGGTVIGVLADSLLKTATQMKWRNGLMAGHVVLVSPFYPEAGFSAGNAMGRNKYIYCLADAALVVHSGKKGGTIAGAEENLKKSWVPLWVQPSSDPAAANADLVAGGGRWINPDQLIVELLSGKESMGKVADRQEQIALFAGKEEQGSLFQGVSSEQVQESLEGEHHPLLQGNRSPEKKKQPLVIAENQGSIVDFYQIFVGKLAVLAATPVKLDELVATTGLNKKQLGDWLKRAHEENKVRKLERPVRYQALQGR